MQSDDDPSHRSHFGCEASTNCRIEAISDAKRRRTVASKPFRMQSVDEPSHRSHFGCETTTICCTGAVSGAIPRRVIMNHRSPDRLASPITTKEGMTVMKPSKPRQPQVESIPRPKMTSYERIAQDVLDAIKVMMEAVPKLQEKERRSKAFIRTHIGIPLEFIDATLRVIELTPELDRMEQMNL